MKKVMRALEITVKFLEKEWGQSGEIKYQVQITREDAKMMLSQIYQFGMENQQKIEHMEDVPFREILSLIKEDYVALRIARKCKREYEKMVKKGHAAGVINLDQEEKGVLYSVLPEFEM